MLLLRQMALSSPSISISFSFSCSSPRISRLPKPPSSISPSLSNPLLRSLPLLRNPRTTRSLTPFRSPTRSLFTGIVEEMGEVLHLGTNDTGGIELQISAKTLSGVHLGDSIAVNGTCLTVSSFDPEGSHFTVGLSPETLRKTSLFGIRSGDPVNLERALQPISRMGGHFVQGHVDGTGEIVSMVPEGDSLWVKVRAPPEIVRYVVPKGFITVDGTSLTVVGVYDEECCFDFMLVAYTQQKVVIPLKKVGEKVNLEVDILGKYVEKLLKCGIGAGEDAGLS